ncbi:hypothetical protein BDV35DRAFT_366873 [Aspergillus flavus]|uniref:Uncharacterized protein n=1 Tax=Aspergillus flavus TaxID=5059 RepID=A0A5N6GK19_ASPFL|nr:hypothetical protein BDV35DRAFT_366873 [Aspergillus flavus]
MFSFSFLCISIEVCRLVDCHRKTVNENESMMMQTLLATPIFLWGFVFVLFFFLGYFSFPPLLARGKFFLFVFYLFIFVL